jgi:hypothetical protein
VIEKDLVSLMHALLHVIASQEIAHAGPRGSPVCFQMAYAIAIRLGFYEPEVGVGHWGCFGTFLNFRKTHSIIVVNYAIFV